MKTNFKKLIPSLIFPQLAGLFGSLFTIQSVSTWYTTITKASFNPPGWVFGPAWTVLYILMGIASYLIWQQVDKPFGKLRDRRAKNALTIFWVHLFFNASWSWVFFGLHLPRLALLNLLILWVFVIIMIGKFYRIDKRASYLLIPYLLWLSFAGVLNYFIWILN